MDTCQDKSPEGAKSPTLTDLIKYNFILIKRKKNVNDSMV